MEHLDELPMLPGMISELRNPESAELSGGPADWYEAAKGWRQAYLEAVDRYNDAAARYNDLLRDHNELLLEHRCHLGHTQQVDAAFPRGWRARLEGLGQRLRSFGQRTHRTAALWQLEVREFLRGAHGPAKSR